MKNLKIYQLEESDQIKGGTEGSTTDLPRDRNNVQNPFNT